MVFLSVSDESLQLMHEELVVLFSKCQILLKQSLESVADRDLLSLQERLQHHLWRDQ
jgi:hypothetical protein